MKKILILLTVMVCWSCYEDDLIVVEDEQNNLHATSELTQLLRGVSSHNTTYDQILDGSTCFSIEFPYQLILENGNSIAIEDESDLQEFANSNHQDFEFIYPIQIKTADYVQHQVSHKNQHLDLLGKCHEGELFKDHIDCASLIFPMQLSVSHTHLQRFEEIQLNNAEELYLFLADLNENLRFKINYPLAVITFVDQHDEVNHNEDLLRLILDASRHTCKVIE